ncbi:MAG: GatB/YqeY domain-containing protein [Planctomycetota bacterium]
MSAGPMQERITADMKAALKGGDKDRLSVLRMLLNDLKNEGDAKGGLDEDGEVAVLRRAAKMRRDSIEQAEAAGRDDIASSERAELVVIEGYLPQLMDAAETEAKVADLLAELGITSRKEQGRFMKEWMARYKAVSDGKTVNACLGKLLS